MINKILLKFFTTNIISFIHRIYVSQLKNKKKYIASTKTKSEVRGGGRKPWRQKGTGNARAGSIRSPLWKGGGVIFGPKPFLIYKKINKKEKKLAIIFALFLKYKNFIFIKESIINNFNEIKTNKFLDILLNLNINKDEKNLFILSSFNKNFYFSSRNIKNIKINFINSLNLNDLLKANKIIISIETFQFYLLNRLLILIKKYEKY